MQTNDYEENRKALLNLVLERAIQRSEEGFVLASGRKSNLYIDLRKITQDPLGIGLIGSMVLQKILELAPRTDCVGGLETGSIPISTAVTLLSNSREKSISAFWVRKKQKEHGLQNKIEGNLLRNATIVEDTATTGGSSLQAVDAVRQAGARGDLVLAFVDRGAIETFEKAGFPFFSIFTEKDLLID